MNFAYPSQRFQDWLSQQWCIWRGQKIDIDNTKWLAGPYGNTDLIADDFFDKLARDENLEVKRHVKGRGLLSSITELGLTQEESNRLCPGISHFYENTSLYDFNLSIHWNPFFRFFGWLINFLYCNRLKQLNFPLKQQELSSGINSEVVTLSDPSSGNVKYTIWYRTLKSNGRVLFSGIYTTCKLPSGDVCIKVIFPLPRGNATVIMKPSVGVNGELHLKSSGNQYGEPGFYFLLNDSKGNNWTQYIRSFRENLKVFIDEEGKVHAEHAISLWRKRVFELRYKILPIL